MNRKGRNVSASVQARLLQLSRASKLSLQDLLERYCTERLLYRLSLSPHRTRFVLKGAMLLIVWGEGSSERVTRDADLLGFGDNSPGRSGGAEHYFRDRARQAWPVESLLAKSRQNRTHSRFSGCS
jgi:Nucleotidyl transferase AbiEii toxin, Type IV TA system